MKRGPNGLIFTVISFFILAGVAYGKDAKLIQTKNSFAFGLVSTYFDYEEPGMEETGFLYGISGSYTRHYDDRLFLTASLEFILGRLDYDGHIYNFYDSNDVTPFQTNTDDWVLESRVLACYTYHPLSNILVFPFTGMGYRFWNDDINGIAGYGRKIKYWYFPIGLRVFTPLSNNWIWGISVEYDIFWGGNVESGFSDVIPGLNDPEMSQNFWDGYGARLSIDFKKRYTKKKYLSIKPFIRYWDIDKSKTAILVQNEQIKGYSYEPQNNTTSYGVDLGFEF